MDNVQRVRDLGPLSSTWDIFIKSFPSGLRELYRRGGRKTVRDRGGGHQQGKSTLLTQQNWCTHELTEKARAHMRRAQARQNPASKHWEGKAKRASLP